MYITIITVLALKDLWSNSCPTVTFLPFDFAQHIPNSEMAQNCLQKNSVGREEISNHTWLNGKNSKYTNFLYSSASSLHITHDFILIFQVVNQLIFCLCIRIWREIWNFFRGHRRQVLIYSKSWICKGFILNTI